MKISKYHRNFLILLTGGVISQAIAFSASPILSRIYDPEIFGKYGYILSLSTIFATIGSLRYDLAIVLPKKTSDSNNLFKLCFIILISLCGVISVGLIGFKLIPPLSEFWKNEFYYLIPLFVFGQASINIFHHFLSTTSNFKTISNSYILKNLSLVLLQIVIGFFLSRKIGLFYGQLLSLIVVNSFLLSSVAKNLTLSFNTKRIKQLAYKHKDFPIFNAPQAFLNSVSQNASILVFEFFFTTHLVGLFWLAFRVLQIPLNVISQSIRKVFYKEASSLYNNNEKISPLLISNVKILAGLGIAPAVIIFLYGEEIFGFVFGKEWIFAGRIASYLIIWLFFLFLNPPSLTMYQILNKQKLLFYLEVFGICTKFLSLFIGIWQDSFLLSVILLCVSGALNNIILILISGYLLKKYESR